MNMLFRWALRAAPLPAYDNFYTPKNSEFYSKFEYMNLEPGDQKIRLLRIQPLGPGEDKSSRIKCELVDNQSLAAIRGQFTTLSYCAGSPKQTETIIVNGLEFNAFSNLGHALRQVRHFWAEKYGDARELLVWADQICINQSNATERSHQVKFMGEIYGSAMQVLVCLSVEGDCTGGIRWLEEFSNNFLEYEKSRSSNEHINEFGEDMDYGLMFLSENFKEEGFHRGWDTFLSTILKSPWWPRAWIRQEYLCSPDAYLLAADESMHWKPAAEAIGRYYQASSGFCTFGDNPACPNSLKKFSNDCQACLHATEGPSGFWESGKRASRLLKLKSKVEFSMPCSSDLLDNLSEMCLCEASDPRDLVYACFGISSHSYGLYPDYASSVSLEDVFIQVAQNVIMMMMMMM